MFRVENNCVGPCPQGCMGSGCPMRYVHVVSCDRCGAEVDPEELYVYDDEELCRDCLLDAVPTVG